MLLEINFIDYAKNKFNVYVYIEMKSNYFEFLRNLYFSFTKNKQHAHITFIRVVFLTVLKFWYMLYIF